MLKYIHVRPPVDQDEWGRPIHCLNHGGFTVAYLTNLLTDNIEWNYSICNNKENFNRKIGREIAKGRFYSPRINNFFWSPNEYPLGFYDFLSDLDSYTLQKKYPLVPFNATW